jgi:hypothetical protein
MRTTFDPQTGRFGPLQTDDAPPGKRFVPPAMSAGGVTLRPMRPSDYEFVQSAELSGPLAVRWRFHGGTPSPEEWAQRTFAGVLAQYLVFTGPALPPEGVVTAYGAQFEHGHVKLAAARFGADERSPAMVLGIALLLRHLFTCWPLRKVYLDVPEYNLDQFASAIGRYFVEEGRLRDHWFYDGQHWDEVKLALYRDRWEEARARLLP